MKMITVGSVSELRDVLNSISSGSQIFLKPGDYSGFDIRDINVRGGVTIRSLDDGDMARLSDVSLRNVSGITFHNVEIISSPKQMNGSISIFNSENIVFDGIDAHGSENKIFSDDYDAIRINSSNGIVVRDSEFHDLRIAVTHEDSNNVVISRNNLYDIRLDGIRGGGTSNLEISENYFTNFRKLYGDHADAIQVYTGKINNVSRGINISNNIVEQGDGARIQGIFIRNSEGGLVSDVEINNNLVIGGDYNGIYVQKGLDVSIRENEIISSGGQSSWIRLVELESSELIGNGAGKYVFSEVSGLEQQDSSITEALRGDSSSIVEAWRESLGLRSGGLSGHDAQQALDSGRATVDDGAAWSARSAILKGGQSTLYLEGDLDIHATGNNGDNSLYGNAGDNKLIGRDGDDRLFGGAGNDTLSGGDGFDVASYANGSTSVVVNIALQAAQVTGEGTDKLIGIEGVEGSRFADSLFGDSRANLVVGGAGADDLWGGGGGDTMFGGIGADTFTYTAVAESKAAAARDIIRDFSGTDGDKIDLQQIDAISSSWRNDAFALVKTFTGVAGQLTVQAAGDHYVVAGDVDGDRAADFVIDVYSKAALDSGNFVL